LKVKAKIMGIDISLKGEAMVSDPQNSFYRK